MATHPTPVNTGLKLKLKLGGPDTSPAGPQPVDPLSTSTPRQPSQLHPPPARSPSIGSSLASSSSPPQHKNVASQDGPAAALVDDVKPPIEEHHPLPVPLTVSHPNQVKALDAIPTRPASRAKKEAIDLRKSVSAAHYNNLKRKFEAAQQVSACSCDQTRVTTSQSFSPAPTDSGSDSDSSDGRPNHPRPPPRPPPPHPPPRPERRPPRPPPHPLPHRHPFLLLLAATPPTPPLPQRPPPRPTQPRHRDRLHKRGVRRAARAGAAAEQPAAEAAVAALRGGGGGG